MELGHSVGAVNHKNTDKLLPSMPRWSFSKWMQTKWTSLAQHVKARPYEVTAICAEVLILIVVFGITFYLKKQENVKSLLPASECPTCINCGSYSLNGQREQINLLLNIEHTNLSSGVANYSWVMLSAVWSSCPIPPQSDKSMLTNKEPWDISGYILTFTVPGASSPTVHSLDDDGDEVVSIDVVANATAATDCFDLQCKAIYGSGYLSSYYRTLNVSAVSDAATSQIGGGVILQQQSVTSYCSAVLFGQYYGYFAAANTITSSNIITCTTYTNSFTALSTAFSYLLTTHGAITLLRFFYKGHSNQLL
jgi:hypothetical protein